MNINEIAKLAGVSRATVSRYLNNGYVSEEKKKNISRHILPICTDTMDMGCGWFLIKLPGN